MTENDVLKIVLGRLGAGAGIPAITSQLAGVLLDISSRADFLTTESVVATVAGQCQYDLPANLKNIYEVVLDDAMLDKLTYRQFLALGDSDGLPTAYALRHQKLALWPTPDAAVDITLDHSMVHPQEFTDVLFGAEFNEAIFEGVLAQLWREKNPDKEESANPHKTAYEAEIEKRIAALDVEIETVLVEYRDI